MKKITQAIVVLLGLVVVASGDAVFAETVLTDDFSGGLVNWATGTNTGINPSGPDISVVNEEVAFSQAHDYIETNSSYGDDFEISFQVRRTIGSSQNFDFLVEVV